MPFLEESWDGMGGMHCRQTATVGLDTFETPATPPASVGGGNTGAGDADADSAGQSGAGSFDNALRLRPVPCKLREAPVRLRG